MLVLWILAVVLLVAYIRYRASRWHMEVLAAKLPGPKAYPLVGSTYLFVGATTPYGVVNVLKKLLNDNGPFYKLWLGKILAVVISDVETVTKVLSGPEAIAKKEVYHFFKPTTDGLFSANETRWHELRKMVNLTMGQKMLENYITCFNQLSVKYCNKLQKTEGTFIDPLLDTANLLIDMAFKTHWGVETNELDDNVGDLTAMSERMFDVVYKRTTNPFLAFDFIFKLFPVYRKLMKSKQRSFDLLSKKVEERIRSIKRENELIEGDPAKKKNVYLDMLLHIAAREGKQNDHNYISTSAVDILVGAADTTSVTICQMFYHIALNPEVQGKVLEEIDSIFGNDTESLVTKEDIQRMKYTEMVMNETLRTYGPPNIPRQVTDDCETAYGTIPKGATVIFAIFSIHRDPKLWEKPDEFYVEHFLPEAVAKRPKNAFMPFMSGARSCPGKYYAYWVIKVLMAYVFRRYTVETDMKLKDLTYKFSIMVSPEQGFSIKFVPRNR